MTTFTALDFETACGPRWSICQVGLVRYEHGLPADEISLLVQPPGNTYWDRFSGIHGLCGHDTRDAPDFSAIWPQILPLIEGQTVVAHNGAFDFSCLSQTLDYYALPYPDFTPQCTYRIYRKGLASLCAEQRIPLDHHDALSDARACATLYMNHLLRSP